MYKVSKSRSKGNILPCILYNKIITMDNVYIDEPCLALNQPVFCLRVSKELEYDWARGFPDYKKISVHNLSIVFLIGNSHDPSMYIYL